ncbi:oligosaccharide flippase family protein [Marinimicrococcus flavescens]|uniref:Oligosaccharide flippase family protein n=1 Tax=Marinimicrococcus flavescens TaxID=3031815 RepID=A0AAP3UZM7_9PROT|nr:oligosaccharide flippase family protein [Marinimicrococcus flavescens]
MKLTVLVESLWVLGTRLILRAANLVVFMILARALSVAEFGFYGYVMATAVVLSVAFDLGQRQSTAFFIGREPENRADYTTHMLFMWLVLGSAGTLACWLMLRVGNYEESYGLLILVGALNTAPMLLLRTGQGAFLGAGRLDAYNRSELVSRIVMVTGTAGLWLADGLTIAAALWLLLASHATAALYLLWRLAGDLRPAALVDWPLIRRMLRHGAVFAGSVLMMILLGRIGIWLVSAMMGEEALGVYFGVLRLGEMLADVAGAVGLVIFSHGVRAADPRESAQDAIRTARLVTAVMALVAVAAMLVAPLFLWLLLGSAYADETLPFRIIMLGTLFGCFNVMLFPCLSAQGLARVGIWAYGLGCAVASLGCWLLIPPLGLEGAAIAYLLAQIVVASSITLVYRHRFGFRAGEILLLQREDLAVIRQLAGRVRARLGRRFTGG